MPDLYDQNAVGLIVHAVHHAVIALANAILLQARELLAAGRPRLRGEPLDPADDPAAVFGGERRQLFDG